MFAHNILTPNRKDQDGLALHSMLTLLVVAFVIGRSPDIWIRAISNSPAIGKPAPRMDLVRLCDNETFDTLQSRPPNQAVLLHCWATWCPPCRDEFPCLCDLSDRLQQEGDFQFYPISCERVGGETFEALWSKTSNFFESEGLSRVAYADPRGVTRRSMAERMEQQSLCLPTSMLVGVDGTIVGVWEGYTANTIAEIEAAVQKEMLQIARAD